MNKTKRGTPIPVKIRKEIHRVSNGACEARLSGCSWFATEIHHLLSRARGGGNTMNNLLALCSICHSKITTHRPGTEYYRFSLQDSPEAQSFKDKIAFRYRRSF